MIADTATEVEALRSLVYRTAWMVDTGQPYTRGRHLQAASAPKWPRGPSTGRCRSTARWATTATSRSSACGATRIAEIFEGTNEIQRIVIAEQVLRPYGVRVRP